MLHLALHFIVPLAVSLVFFLKHWRLSFTLMMAGMLIDLDHLLADPIYDPERCSVGFHPLHMPIPIAVYCLMLLHAKTRLVGIGLLIHIVLDSIDCQLTNGVWYAV